MAADGAKFKPSGCEQHVSVVDQLSDARSTLADPQHNRGRDLFGDRRLLRQIQAITVERVRPDVRLIPDADEVGYDAHLAAVSLHLAEDEILRAERLAQRLHV